MSDLTFIFDALHVTIRRLTMRTQFNPIQTEIRFLGTCAVLACLASLLGACATESFPTPTPIATLSPSATWTLTKSPTEARTQTRTQTLTITPTLSPTIAPRASATQTLRRLPTATASPTSGPSATPSLAQICASVAAKGKIGIYVMYLHPAPDLVWDTTPRQFKAGLCNTIPRPSVPQGKYKIVMNFPPGNRGSTQSSEVRAELLPGFNEVSIGPWIPGLENHLAACAMRANADTQVMYNDTPDPFFHALVWIDGSDRAILPIQCGGNYP